MLFVLLGRSFCRRSTSSTLTCGRKRRSRPRNYPQGYCDLLERQQDIFIASLQKMYRRLQTAGMWEGPTVAEVEGDPLVHDILAGLGLLANEPTDDNCGRLDCEETAGDSTSEQAFETVVQSHIRKIQSPSVPKAQVGEDVASCPSTATYCSTKLEQRDASPAIEQPSEDKTKSRHSVASTVTSLCTESSGNASASRHSRPSDNEALSNSATFGSDMPRPSNDPYPMPNLDVVVSRDAQTFPDWTNCVDDYYIVASEDPVLYQAESTLANTLYRDNYFA